MQSSCVFTQDLISPDYVQVFADTKHLVQSAVDGYNVCIFAYGQTGSGKTYTIYGDDRGPGITPRGIHELFDILDRDASKYLFSVSTYMLELYQDELTDLLIPADKGRGPQKVCSQIEEVSGSVEYVQSTI